MSARDFVSFHHSRISNLAEHVGVNHRDRSCALDDVSGAVARAINCGVPLDRLYIDFESDGPGHMRVVVATLDTNWKE
jgi:hypothetical protein